MRPRRGKKGIGRRVTPNGLSLGAESEVMTVRDVAQYMHCHYVTVYRLIRLAGFPGFGWAVMSVSAFRSRVDCGGRRTATL